MADDKQKNKRGFEDKKDEAVNAAGQKEDVGKDDNASDETKTFDAVGEKADKDETVYFNSDESGNIDQFSIDGSGKEPLERCEERGSVKSYTLTSVAWRIARPFLILVISAALLYYLGNLAYHYIEDTYFSPVDAQASVTKEIEIKQGSSLSSIARVLFDEGIIRNKFVFQMYVDLQDMGSSLIAGTYEFSPSMTMDDIIKILGEGGEGREIIKVTFTEGMTAMDIAETLENKGILDEDTKKTFLELCNDKEEFADYKVLDSVINSEDEGERKYLLEGYLFPDTYEIYADAQPVDIINKLLSRFDDIFTLDYEDRAKELGMDINDVMALASIIEWESLPKDFKKISAIFHNRLKEKMQFDSCATLRYVTGEKKLVYTEEEKNIDSPYNTYRNAGLPLGPVANPGKKAIEAALYPEEEFMEQGYLYFCNKDPETGDLAFAKDLDEHNANVEMYKHLW